MISLRRNDKIIIIIGVIILLAAGAGVALYSPSQVNTPSPPTQHKSNNYPVQWVLENETLPEISEYAPKGAPFYINKTLGHANIKTVSFHLSWIDDHAFLRRFGLDTLTLAVTTPDGSSLTAVSMKSQRRIKAGDFTIYDNLTTPLPPIKTINGSSPQAALQNVEAQFKTNPWLTKGINMSVTVTIGEHFPFRFLDKGNPFTLQINYTYYAPKIANMTGTGYNDIPPDIPEASEPWTPPYMSMIIGTGCGRYV
jgi:hypothetical protein